MLARCLLPAFSSPQAGLAAPTLSGWEGRHAGHGMLGKARLSVRLRPLRTAGIDHPGMPHMAPTLPRPPHLPVLPPPSTVPARLEEGSPACLAQFSSHKGGKKQSPRHSPCSCPGIGATVTLPVCLHATHAHPCYMVSWGEALSPSRVPSTCLPPYMAEKSQQLSSMGGNLSWEVTPWLHVMLLHRIIRVWMVAEEAPHSSLPQSATGAGIHGME